MLRLVPPAGTKLAFGQAAQMCARTLVPRREADAAAQLAEFLGTKHLLSVGSGRAALYAILKAFHSIHPERDIVAVPAYTCYSVPAAIIRAGLRILPVEIDPATLDFDFTALDSIPGDQLLAVVGTELFGFIGDVDRLKATAASKCAFVVDDAAQAFGSAANGRSAGLLGDVGFYSIGRGKPLFGMSGGLILTNCEDISREIAKIIEGFEEPSLIHSVGDCVRLTGYFTLFRPLLYGIADALPFLNLGATIYDPQFQLAQLSRGTEGLLKDVVALANASVTQRQQVAGEIMSTVGACSRFTFPKTAVPCGAAYPRLPVIAETKQLRDSTVDAMRKAGIGASAFYPTAICDIPGISDHMATEAFHCKKAERLSETLFTLPTHSLVTPKDIVRIAEILKGAER